LGVAWVVAYPLSWSAFGLVRARRPQQFRAPLAAWSAVLVAAGVPLAHARPCLLWVGAAYAVAFVVNLGYARRNNERALANDLVFVGECAAMVWVTWAVSTGDSGAVRPPALAAVPGQVWVLVVVCALVLTGSTLHVKSLIRERRDPRYAATSRVYALASLPVAAGLAVVSGLPAGAWLVVPFVVLGTRAFVVGPGRRPGFIGMVELGCFVVTWVAALAAG
jgi:hypothetical protein